MPVQNSNTTRDLSLVASRIYKFIDSFQTFTGYSNTEMAKELSVSQSDYKRILRGTKGVCAESFAHFLDRYNVSFDSLVQGDVDERAVFEYFSGNFFYLPEKYQVSAKSYRRSAIYMLDYIENMHGPRVKRNIMKRLQINEVLLQEPDEMNNILLSQDICSALYERTKSKNQLESMGRNFYANSKESKIGKILSKIKSVPQIYERMFTGLVEKYVENNFIWKLHRVDQHSCLISGFPNQELLESFSIDQLNNLPMSYLREGFLSVLPRFSGNHDSSIHKKACLSQGDSYYQYEVVFPVH